MPVSDTRRIARLFRLQTQQFHYTVCTGSFIIAVKCYEQIIHRFIHILILT